MIERQIFTGEFQAAVLTRVIVAAIDVRPRETTLSRFVRDVQHERLFHHGVHASGGGGENRTRSMPCSQGRWLTFGPLPRTLVTVTGIEPTLGLGVNQLQATFCYPPNLVYGAGLEPALRGYRPRFLPIGRPVVTLAQGTGIEPVSFPVNSRTLVTLTAHPEHLTGQRDGTRTRNLRFRKPARILLRLALNTLARTAGVEPATS